jgi:uncharacterized zinc-type alcohol dehydrogenase-like protein
MYPTKGYATHSATEPLKPFSFERRDPLPNDVQIDIQFLRGMSFRFAHRSQ